MRRWGLGDEQREFGQQWHIASGRVDDCFELTVKTGTLVAAAALHLPPATSTWKKSYFHCSVGWIVKVKQKNLKEVGAAFAVVVSTDYSASHLQP